MIAKGIRTELIERVWPLIETWVAEALENGGANETPDLIRNGLLTGNMQLWLAWDGERAHGCCITELYDSRRGMTCGLVVVAGLDFKRWRPLTETIKEWARGEGCARLEAGGRDGWQRYVRADGWRKLRTIIEMDLQNG